MRISARNRLCGTVKSISEGVVNSKVVIELRDAPTVTAVITKEAVADLGLAEGAEAFALIKASDVMVGVCEGGSATCQKQ
jgi:molybdate transport system regulatory protein